MADPKVNGLRSIELNVFNLKESTEFYKKAWGLDEVKMTGGSAYLRATGPNHHVLALHEEPRAGMRTVNFSAADRATVDGLHAKVTGIGAKVHSSPYNLPGEAGGGYGFEVSSPEGQHIRISADVASHSHVVDDKARPSCLNHVVINAASLPTQMEFYCDVLGFKLSDNNGHMSFIRCSSNHHSIALAQSQGACLNHAAFEMQDFVGLMEGVGRVRLNDCDVGWGVGRHSGPGRNIFSYFVDPNGFAIEYTTEVEQVDDSYVTHFGDYWQAQPLRPCSWAGTKTVPTKWMAEAMNGVTVEKRNASCDDVISEKMAS
ncbi:MAG: VOC family protein [Beijerinckiaceae bacterium]|jgi:catechol-2,3-dioxygenase|nr:VOC family protein [Beijerinckiaceae bacterium]